MQGLTFFKIPPHCSLHLWESSNAATTWILRALFIIKPSHLTSFAFMATEKAPMVVGLRVGKTEDWHDFLSFQLASPLGEQVCMAMLMNNTIYFIDGSKWRAWSDEFWSMERDTRVCGGGLVWRPKRGKEMKVISEDLAGSMLPHLAWWHCKLILDYTGVSHLVWFIQPLVAFCVFHKNYSFNSCFPSVA